MTRLLLFLFWLFLLSSNATAVMVNSIDLPEQVSIAGERLELNGYGLRKKFFFKIYLGSLYTSRPVSSAEQALNLATPKLIRMDFLYKKVERGKITGAFFNGFEKNTPELAEQPSVKEFLNLFDSDFKAGDRVELRLTSTGVSASHNGRLLGRVKSPELARGVLLIYLGESPADPTLKQGLLGRH